MLKYLTFYLILIKLAHFLLGTLSSALINKTTNIKESTLWPFTTWQTITRILSEASFKIPLIFHVCNEHLYILDVSFIEATK